MPPRLPLFLSPSTLIPVPYFLPFRISHRFAQQHSHNSPYRKCRTPHSSANLETPTTLLQRIETNPALRILDLRGSVAKPTGRVKTGFQPTECIADDEAYNTSHIPTATFLDWRIINIAQPHTLCDTLSSHGVTRDTPVVLYDWGDMLFATRAWLALMAVGVNHISVLDGGWNAWDRADAPVDNHSPCPLTIYAEMESDIPEGDIPRVTVSLKNMRELVNNPNATIVDARSEKQFKGIERRAKRAGRIPGSVNVPYRQLLKEDGIGLKSDSELHQILGNAGLLDRGIVAYCNAGVASTLVLFCLVRCGVPLERLRNYCGSWGDWGNIEDTPIETG